MKLLNIIAVLLFSAPLFSALGQEPEVFYENEKAGLRAAGGQLLLPAVYDEIYYCNSHFGLWYIRKGDLHAIYNKRGEPLSDFRYSSIRCYDSHIVAGIDDNFGILDQNGKPITPIVYSSIQEFHFCTGSAYDNERCLDALAIVERHGKFGALNALGKEIIPLEMDAITYEYDCYRVTKNGKVGWMNAQGVWIVQPVYEEGFFIYGTNDRLIRVAQSIEVRDPREPSLIYISKKWGVIDRNGKVLIPLQYEELDAGYDQGQIIAQKNGKKGVIDTSGNLIIPFDYEELTLLNTYYSPYANFNAYAEVKNGEYVYWINKRGETVFDPKYHSIIPLGDDYLRVSLNDNFGLIDLQGNVLVPVEFGNADLFGFNNDLYFLVTGKETQASDDYTPRVGIMDRNGKWLLQPEYQYIMKTYFSDSLCILVKDGKSALAGPDFRLKTGFVFDDINTSTEAGFIKVMQKNKTGLIDLNGREVIPCKYADIQVQYVSDDYSYGEENEIYFFIMVKQKGEWWYYSKKGKLLPASITAD